MAGAGQSVGIRVRRAEKRDIAELANLAGQLGYPSSAEEIRERLTGIDSAPDHELFVADAGEGKLCGFLNIFVMRTIDTGTRAEVAALVVDEARRSQKIGQILLDHAENWARERGCRTIGLRSNVIRDRAHAFYEREGYEHYKTQKAFRKFL